jgi:hypothetical protein
VKSVSERKEKSHGCDGNELTDMSEQCIGEGHFLGDTEQCQPQDGEILEISNLAGRRWKYNSKSDHHLQNQRSLKRELEIKRLKEQKKI